MMTEVEEILATLGLETQEEKDQLQAILNELVPAGKELSVKQKEEDPPPAEETKAEGDDDEEDLEEESPEEEEVEQRAESKGGLVGTISEKLQALCAKLEGAERESLDGILLLVSSLGQEKQIDPDPEPSQAVAEAINDRLGGLGERVSTLEGLESRILALEAAFHEVKELGEKTEALEAQVGGLGTIQQFLSSRPKAATRPSQEVAALDPASELVKQVEKEAREVQGASGPLSGFIGYRGSDSD